MTVSPPGPGTPASYGMAPLPERRTRWWLLAIFGLLSLVAAAALAWFAYDQTDSLGGSLLVLVCALLPIPVVVGCFMWIDRYEPEPSIWVAAAIAWGAVIAAGLALVANTIVAEVTDMTLAWLATGVAPITEEITKGLFLVVLAVFFRSRIRTVLDGVLYSGLVGVGFAFSENILYYTGAYSGALTPDLEGPEATVGLFIARGVISPFAHPMFCIAFGIGVGIAASTHRRWLRWVAPPVGLLLSMALHAAWNGSVSFGGPVAFVLVYGLLFLPAFIGGIAFAAVLRTRQGRLLIASLEDAARRGWLHVDEIPWMTRFGFKRRARIFAAEVAGKPAKDAVAAYQRAVGRMGFAHDRVMHGRGGPDGVATVLRQLHEMRSVRPDVVLPPPIRVPVCGFVPRHAVSPGWPPPGHPSAWSPDGRGTPPSGEPHSWRPHGPPTARTPGHRAASSEQPRR